MKRNTIKLWIAVLIPLLIIGFIFFRIRSRNDNSYSGSFNRYILIENGKADPERSTVNFGIDSDGVYDLALSFLPIDQQNELMDPEDVDFHYITGCVITSESGELIHATAGGWLTFNKNFELKKGTYQADFYYITNKQQYYDFLCNYEGTAQAEQYAADMDFDSFVKDGENNVRYRITVSSSLDITGSRLFLLFMIIILCLILILAFVHYEVKNREKGPDYDERQEVERGRGFKYAFYAMIVYITILYIFDAVGFIAKDYYVWFYMGAVILGTLVQAVYSIWHDCYFTMNVSKVKTLGIICAISLPCLVFGVFDIIISKTIASDNPVFGKNTLFRIGVVGIAVASMMVVIAVTLALKHIADSKENNDDEA